MNEKEEAIKKQYELDRAEIIRRLGPSETDGMGGPGNETARQLSSRKGKYLADLRQCRSEALTGALDETRLRKSKQIRLNSIDLSETDLAGFTEKEQDILIAWFEDKSCNSKTLANRFGVSYQFVTALLRDKRVQKLDAQYFQRVLLDNTKIALLKLTQDADPKVSLAAADYLKLMQDKQGEGNGSKSLEDPEAEKVLQMVGDWLLGDRSSPLLITKEHLAEA